MRISALTALTAVASVLVLTVAVAPQDSTAQQEYTIRNHGEDCTREIGPIAPFSCLDGEIIPIALDGQPILDDQHRVHQKCDRPPLLGLGMAQSQGQCVPFSRIGTLPGRNAQGHADPNIQWAFICRRYKVRTNREDPMFEDVAVVGHNKATGATCFFQMLDQVGPGDYRAKKATRVPPPDEPQQVTPAGEIPAAQFWLPPRATGSIGCYTCHDNDPFIHTPHVDQVGRMVGSRWVSMVPPGPDLSANPPEQSRYKHVGLLFQQAWPKPQRIKPLGNACTKCHNIGRWASCERFAKIASGRDSPAYTSDYGKTFPRSHWMPPDVESTGMTQQGWDDIYKTSLEKIQACCLAPGAASCRLSNFDD